MVCMEAIPIAATTSTNLFTKFLLTFAELFEVFDEQAMLILTNSNHEQKTIFLLSIFSTIRFAFDIFSTTELLVILNDERNRWNFSPFGGFRGSKSEIDNLLRSNCFIHRHSNILWTILNVTFYANLSNFKNVLFKTHNSGAQFSIIDKIETICWNMDVIQFIPISCERV